MILQSLLRFLHQYNTYYELAKQENAQLGRKLRHNTIKLLKHYSQLQSYVDNAITDSTQAEEIWLNELLIDMFDDKSIVKVNAIVKSKEKTALMMRHVNNMLDMKLYIVQVMLI